MGVLLDVVNNAVRRRGRSEEPREEMRSLSTEPEIPLSRAEDGKKSEESEVKMGKRRASEGGSGDGEDIARKSDDSEKASKTSSDSGSDVSCERRGRARKKTERNMGLWEKL